MIRRLYPAVDPDFQRRHKSVAWFVTTFSLVLFFILVSTIIIAASKYQSGLAAPNLFTFAGIGLLVGATGFAAGGFLGFLFGVPKMRSNDDSDRGREVDSNTNLEQVSDWLTKIIVGVGLVEFQSINGALLDFASTVDSTMVGGSAVMRHGAGFTANLILVGSAIAGFLAAYLKAKTDLMDAFGTPLDKMRNNFGEAVAEHLISDVGREALNRPHVDPERCSRDAAAKMIQFIQPGTEDAKLHELLGLSHAILGNYRASGDALRKAADLLKDGQKDDLPALAARAMAIAGDPTSARSISQASYKAADLASSDSKARIFANESKLAEMFSELYARGGFSKALEIGHQLAADQEMNNSGRLWLYMAAAYGQQHAALLQAGEVDPAALSASRAEALSAINKAIQLDRAANLPVLKMLYARSSSKPKEEDDLESFYGDPEFEAILGSASDPENGTS